MKKKYELTPKSLFLSMVIALGIFGIFWICYTRGECINFIMAEVIDKFAFIDFFDHIFYIQAPQNVYDVDVNACFPPLAYMFYWVIAQMLPENAVVMHDTSSLSSYAILLFVVYYVILGILFYDSISRLLQSREAGNNGLLLTILISISSVFVLAVVWSGNAAFIACILLLRALELREHDDKWSRELALILIAVAAGIKIYPAVFGMLYLKEKRYREAGRLILYGMICFFVPFVFFGGFHGLVQMLLNQKKLHSLSLYGWRNILATWNKLDSQFLHLNLPIIGKMLTWMYAVISMIGMWILQDTWKRLFMVCSLMVIVPYWSGAYTVIYLVIPLLYFLSEEHKKRMDYIYAVLFVGMFCLFVWNTPAITNITGDLSWAVRYLSIYVMSFLLVLETLGSSIRMVSARKK